MQDRVGGPAVMLLVSGVFSLVYSIVYLLWTLMPLGTGMLVVVAEIDENGFTDETLPLLFAFLAIPTVQMVGYMLCALLSAMVIVAGRRFDRLQRKGLVFLGLAASTAVPLIGMVVSTASSLNCGTLGAGVFGCLLANTLTLPVLVVGFVATVWGLVTLTGPLGDRFEDP